MELEFLKELAEQQKVSLKMLSDLYREERRWKEMRLRDDEINNQINNQKEINYEE